MAELRNTPWADPSHDDEATHAILHIAKAAGKLASIIENEGLGGRQGEYTRLNSPRYAADLVIYAIRLCDLWGIDLEEALATRQRLRNSKTTA